MLSIAADNGFDALEEHSTFVNFEVVLNLISEDEHEPYIEWFDRTIKGR